MLIWFYVKNCIFERMTDQIFFPMTGPILYSQ